MPHIDLLELPYFEGIGIDAVVALVDLMAPVTFADGEVIMREGAEEPPPLYIATTGGLLISKHSETLGDRPLAELETPTLFGEIELFCQIAPVTTVTARGVVSSFKLTRQTFDHLFASQHPALMTFTFNVARVACHRLAIADDMLTNLLDNEDLVKLRNAVLNRMHRSNWQRTTGAFRR